MISENLTEVFYKLLGSHDFSPFLWQFPAPYSDLGSRRDPLVRHFLPLGLHRCWHFTQSCVEKKVRAPMTPEQAHEPPNLSNTGGFTWW